MKYRQLFQDGPEVSAIAFGCFPMGHWLWSGVDDEASAEAVEKALDLGINFFDNADCYGFGHAETLLAKVLGSRIKDCFIATKGGVQKLDDGTIQINTRKDYLLRACEASLERLGVDCIDLYQVHWPNHDVPAEETMAGLLQLRDEGKIKYLGVSNYRGSWIEEHLKHGPLHTHQPPYNLLNRDIEQDSKPVCEAHGMGLLAYGPLYQGLLTGKYTRDTIDFPEGDHRRDHKAFNEPQLSINLRIIEGLKPLAEEAGKTLAELAVAWVLARGEHVTALCGAKNGKQIAGVAGAADWALSQGDLARIDAVCDEARAAAG